MSFKNNIDSKLTLLFLGYQQTGTGEGPSGDMMMPLHLHINQKSDYDMMMTEIHQVMVILTGNPLKYKMDYSIFIVSICME